MKVSHVEMFHGKWAYGPMERNSSVTKQSIWSVNKEIAKDRFSSPLQYYRDDWIRCLGRRKFSRVPRADEWMEATVCVEIISAVTRQIRLIENEVDWKKKRCPHEHEVATYTVMTVSRKAEDPMLSNSSCAVVRFGTNRNRKVDTHHVWLLKKYDECRVHVQTSLRPQGARTETVSGPQILTMAEIISIDSWSSSKNGS